MVDNYNNENQSESMDNNESNDTLKNENTNAECSNNEDSKVELPFDETLNDDLRNGLHSILFERIGNVSINDIRIQDAFTKFIKEVEHKNSFSILDIIKSAESGVKHREPNENAGNIIYGYDHFGNFEKSFGNKLLNNSVGGIYSLFSICNGITFDLEAAGNSMAAAEAKRYLIIPSGKAQKMIDNGNKVGFHFTKVGEVLSTNKIIITKKYEIISTVDKSLLNNKPLRSITFNAEHYNAFREGYNSVCSIILCNCIGANNLIRFGLNGDIATVCARALGYYSALTYLKSIPVRSVFVNENNANVAVSRPRVVDGDYLYLLRLRTDNNGIPDKGHFGQLYYYLGEKRKSGIIKDVLPVGENVNRVIARLCNDKLGYVSIAQVPENCFGVIVSVGRGESVNGIKLGYFKDIL